MNNPNRVKDMSNAIPNSNGLKYIPTNMVLGNGRKVRLTADENDIISKKRWNDVMLRPRIFYIRQSKHPCFVDITMGRPPTWVEDFCINCYEIPPLKNDYRHCPGCMSRIESVDTGRRNHFLQLTSRNK